jgi:glycosyltransferase involved in cell wall biosynthesis
VHEVQYDQTGTAVQLLTKEVAVGISNLASELNANRTDLGMHPDITVIIPSHNRLWSLPKAVESCRSSALQIQIIVIDDASTDGTGAWLKTQQGLEVLQGEGWGKPWGVGKALNLAKGTYLRYLDSDDWLNPGTNERQFEIAEREQADVVVAGLDIYRDEVFVKTDPWLSTDDFIAQQLGESRYSAYSAFLFRRSFIEDIPHRTLFPSSDFASRDDRCFMLEVALRHPRIAVCSTPTLCYRQHSKERLQFPTGLRAVGTNIQTLYIYRQIVNLLDQRSELTPRRRKAAGKILWPLAHMVAYSHLIEACEIAEWVFKLDPEFRVPEKGLLGVLYRRMGFRKTELLLGLRRTFLTLFRPKPNPQSLKLK